MKIPNDQNLRILGNQIVANYAAESQELMKLALHHRRLSRSYLQMVKAMRNIDRKASALRP